VSIFLEKWFLKIEFLKIVCKITIFISQGREVKLTLFLISVYLVFIGIQIAGISYETMVIKLFWNWRCGA
jgi:hypothetical protein